VATRLFHISDVHFGVEDRAALAEVARAVAARTARCAGLHRRYHPACKTQRICRCAGLVRSAWRARSARNRAITTCPTTIRCSGLPIPSGVSGAWTRLWAGSWNRTMSCWCRCSPRCSAQWRFPWSDGVVKGPATDAQTSRRARSGLHGDPRVRVVIAHHPSAWAGRWSPQSHDWRRQCFFEQLAAAGAHAILSGHVHVPLDEVRERGGHACADDRGRHSFHPAAR
jgi:hypothetical protein